MLVHCWVCGKEEREEDNSAFYSYQGCWFCSECVTEEIKQQCPDLLCDLCTLLKACDTIGRLNLCRVCLNEMEGRKTTVEELEE